MRGLMRVHREASAHYANLALRQGMLLGCTLLRTSSLAQQRQQQQQRAATAFAATLPPTTKGPRVEKEKEEGQRKRRLTTRTMMMRTSLPSSATGMEEEGPSTLRLKRTKVSAVDVLLNAAEVLTTSEEMRTAADVLLHGAGGSSSPP